MRCVFGTVAVAAAILAAPAGGAPAAATSTALPGTWRKLPAAPFAVRQALASVWTGKELIVFGRNPTVNPAVDVSEAYDPAAARWTRLSPPAGPGYVPSYDAVWTGKEMLSFGAFHSVSFTASNGKWRELPKPVPGGLVVWTGREAIGWGGGCCGDAWSNGVAYNPSTRAYRNLPRSPLAPSQHPLGAWTGRELILFVSDYNLEGRRWPARLARAAAYNPGTNTWRRLAPMPETGPGSTGVGAWDGRELLVVAAGSDGRSTWAFDPGSNRWRPRAPLPAGRRAPAVVWTGKRLVVWGGENAGGTRPLNDGVAYDPANDRWSHIPPAPLRPRGGSAVAWTGRDLLVWGGGPFADGAALRPAA